MWWGSREARPWLPPPCALCTGNEQDFCKLKLSSQSAARQDSRMVTQDARYGQVQPTADTLPISILPCAEHASSIHNKSAHTRRTPTNPYPYCAPGACNNRHWPLSMSRSRALEATSLFSTSAACPPSTWSWPMRRRLAILLSAPGLGVSSITSSVCVRLRGIREGGSEGVVASSSGDSPAVQG